MYIETWEVESPYGNLLQIAYTEEERRQRVVGELRMQMEDMHQCRLVKLLRVDNTDDWTTDTPQTDCKSCKQYGAVSVSCDRCDKSTHSNYEPQTDCAWK